MVISSSCLMQTINTDIEKEIRNRAIDDFAKEIETEYDNDGCPNVSDYLDYKISIRDLFKIAERLKGEENNEWKNNYYNSRSNKDL